MIKTIRHKGLKLFFSFDDASKLATDLVEKICSILTILESACELEDINQPFLRLHLLKGNMKGFYAASVRANWRIVFRFEDGNVYDVDFIDYH
jgi:toxin HigB-1